MLPSIDLGHFVIPTGGLIIILGIWLSLSAIEKGAAAIALPVSETYNLAVVALAAGFIAARLYFVLDHWSAYQENLLGIVWPLTSGFNVWAGLLAGLATSVFYARAKKLFFPSTLDALTPGILVALITISLSDFLAGPGYGTEADLPWSVNLFGIYRHPVQIYEIAVAGVALLTWYKMHATYSYAGQLCLFATAIYSAGRLVVDAFRANAWLTEGGFHVVQVLSLIFLLVSLFLLGHLSIKTKQIVQQGSI